MILGSDCLQKQVRLPRKIACTGEGKLAKSVETDDRLPKASWVAVRQGYRGECAYHDGLPPFTLIGPPYLRCACRACEVICSPILSFDLSLVDSDLSEVDDVPVKSIVH